MYKLACAKDDAVTQTPTQRSKDFAWQTAKRQDLECSGDPSTHLDRSELLPSRLTTSFTQMQLKLHRDLIREPLGALPFASPHSEIESVQGRASLQQCRRHPGVERKLDR